MLSGAPVQRIIIEISKRFFLKLVSLSVCLYWAKVKANETAPFTIKSDKDQRKKVFAFAFAQCKRTLIFYFAVYTGIIVGLSYVPVENSPNLSEISHPSLCMIRTCLNYLILGKIDTLPWNHSLDMS